MAKKKATSSSPARSLVATSETPKPRPVRQAWKFCPRCGVAAAKTGKNPFHCEACGHTHFFGPVSAVGAITTDSEGRVLFLIRAKDPGKGKYGLPGGFVDAGETAEDALHREVFEEIRLKIKAMSYLCSFPNEYVYQGFILPVTDMFFVMEVETFDAIESGDGEIHGWHFCHPGRKELKNMAFESNRRAMELFLKSR
ncbi:MAG: NUDIX domain-containing protein [Planctomycetaceae bacterium]